MTIQEYNKAFSIIVSELNQTSQSLKNLLDDVQSKKTVPSNFEIESRMKKVDYWSSMSKILLKTKITF